MVWYGMVNVDLYSAIVTKVSYCADKLITMITHKLSTWFI